MVFVLFFFIFFDFWPYWLQDLTWQGILYLLIAYVCIAVARLVVWGIFYHIGVRAWLFPNFRKSYSPAQFLWPLFSFEVRADAADPKAVLFRLVSGYMIILTLYQFCQDEKNIEDLKDFAENGINDLFDYSAEWVTKSY